MCSSWWFGCWLRCCPSSSSGTLSGSLRHHISMWRLATSTRHTHGTKAKQEIEIERKWPVHKIRYHPNTRLSGHIRSRRVGVGVVLLFLECRDQNDSSIVTVTLPTSKASWLSVKLAPWPCDHLRMHCLIGLLTLQLYQLWNFLSFHLGRFRESRSRKQKKTQEKITLVKKGKKKVASSEEEVSLTLNLLVVLEFIKFTMMIKTYKSSSLWWSEVALSELSFTNKKVSFIIWKLTLAFWKLKLSKRSSYHLMSLGGPNRAIQADTNAEEEELKTSAQRKKLSLSYSHPFFICYQTRW